MELPMIRNVIHMGVPSFLEKMPSNIMTGTLAECLIPLDERLMATLLRFQLFLCECE
jgi:hypothetical protein